MKALTATLLITCSIITSTVCAETGAEGLKDFGNAVFSEVERKLILDYYQGRYGSIDRKDHDGDRYGGAKSGKKNDKPARGKGKSKGLPPGIAKKLERGGELPPGIAKKRLPDDLETRLPPVRAGYERAEIDGEIVLIEIASQQIADVLRRSAATMSRELFDEDR
jgi:hypothetical protein